MQSNDSTTNNNLSTEQSHNSVPNADASIQNNTLENNISIQNHSDSHQKHNPLDQFKVHTILDFKIGKLDLSITNSAFFMMLSTLLIIVFLLKATSKKLLIPSKSQVLAESLFNFVNNIIKETIGEEGKKFFPLIFSIFLFIFMCNALGLAPYSFTSTSQIAVNFALALIAFFTITIYAIVRNGFFGFLHMFLPSGVPILIAPLIFILELILAPSIIAFRLAAGVLPVVS
jgi:F-type H+-transporting ATPase subunit a